MNSLWQHSVVIRPWVGYATESSMAVFCAQLCKRAVSAQVFLAAAYLSHMYLLVTASHESLDHIARSAVLSSAHHHDHNMFSAINGNKFWPLNNLLAILAPTDLNIPLFRRDRSSSLLLDLMKLFLKYRMSRYCQTCLLGEWSVSVSVCKRGIGSHLYNVINFCDICQ